MNNPKLISHLGKTLLVSLTTIALVGLATGTTLAASSNSITHQSIITLTNQDRSSRGLSTLNENLDLDAAAMAKANDMFGQNYFDHYSPTGETPWDFMDAAGYNYRFAGENLAMDFATPIGINTAWLNSPKHAANIYNSDYSDIGVAVVNGQLEGHQTTLVVQMFGQRQSSALTNIDLPIINTVSNLLGINL